MNLAYLVGIADDNVYEKNPAQRRWNCYDCNKYVIPELIVNSSKLWNSLLIYAVRDPFGRDKLFYTPLCCGAVGLEYCIW